MKPRPKAAPMRPMPFARSSGFVMSAMYALAVPEVRRRDAAEDARGEEPQDAAAPA